MRRKAFARVAIDLPDEYCDLAHKLHGKYDADAAAYDKPGEGRVVVTIEPTRVRPVDMRG